MQGAVRESLTSVFRSSSWSSEKETLNGVGVIFAVEGKRLNAEDIATKECVYYPRSKKNEVENDIFCQPSSSSAGWMKSSDLIRFPPKSFILTAQGFQFSPFASHGSRRDEVCSSYYIARLYKSRMEPATQRPKSVSTVFLDQPPSCLQFCPAAPDHVVIGTYLLSETRETDEDGDVRQAKTGSLQLWNVDPIANTL